MSHSAVIGGSGLPCLEDLQHAQLHEVQTPYGAPSAAIAQGVWQNANVYFLPRHGDPATLPPHIINYRANIWALRELGVKRIFALNIVGGITPDCTTGSLVVPHQMVDYTHSREATFHSASDQPFEHIDFTDPFTADVRGCLLRAANSVNVSCCDLAVYACMQGPRLETTAEVNRLERDGCDIIGMTLMPEAALAREAGLDYAALCLVVNEAAGRGEGTTSMVAIENTLKKGMPAMLTVTAAALLSK